MPKIINVFFMATVLQLTSCSPSVDTGRNDTPEDWEEGSVDSPFQTTGTPPSSDNSPSTSDEATNTNNQRRPSKCFDPSTNDLPETVLGLCRDVIAPVPALAKIHEFFCQRKHLLNAFQNKECGWTGDESKLRRSMRIFERAPESAGGDYEDIHATIVNVPMDAESYTKIVGLAFEDYASFKSKGYQWVSGTRDNRNLNGGRFDSGIDYNFMVEKEAYELGYNAHIQLYKLADGLWIHVNYATGRFVRIKYLGQIAIYAEQADGSTNVIKLEHKAVESRGGLYNRAYKAALELIEDFMRKVRFNAERAVTP
jgi:hypothetical protein